MCQSLATTVARALTAGPRNNSSSTQGFPRLQFSLLGGNLTVSVKKRYAARAHYEIMSGQHLPAFKHLSFVWVCGAERGGRGVALTPTERQTCRNGPATVQLPRIWNKLVPERHANGDQGMETDVLAVIAQDMEVGLEMRQALRNPRVVLADDQREMLDAVSNALGGDFDVVSTVADGASAIESVARLDPDLLVLDISMPILDGLKAAARIRESGSRVKVLFLTVHDDPDYVEAAFSAGARAYVLKARLGTDLLPALRAVLQGRTFVSRPLNGDR